VTKILMIEDDPFNRDMQSRRLERKGYKVVMAETAERGIEMAREEAPDLILMDIGLPDISGYEATRRIKADPGLRPIPIIVVTSYALSGDDQKAIAAGCDAYVAKPFSPRELLATIRRFLPEA
jgi:two-component system, cell cycle response regulator DivK